MKKTTKIITSLTSIAAAALLLVACGSKNSSASSKTVNTAKTASSTQTTKSNKAWFADRSKVLAQLFNTPEQHIWYYFSDVTDWSGLTDDIDNDTPITTAKLTYKDSPRYAMVIKNGYATTYQLGDKKIGELSRMSESAQLAYCKQSDKTSFSKDLAEYTRNPGEGAYNMGVSKAETETYYNFLKQAKYQAPKPYKMHADLTLDSTGNKTKKESIQISPQVPYSNTPKKMVAAAKSDSGAGESPVPFPGLSLEATNEINSDGLLYQRERIDLDVAGYWGAQIMKSAAFGIISPAATRGESCPFLATLVPYKTFMKNQDHIGVKMDSIGTKNTKTVDDDE